MRLTILGFAVWSSGMGLGGVYRSGAKEDKTLTVARGSRILRLVCSATSQTVTDGPKRLLRRLPKMSSQDVGRSGAAANDIGREHHLDVLLLPMSGGKRLDLFEEFAIGDEFARGQR